MPDFAPYSAPQTVAGGIPLHFADEISGARSSTNVRSINARSKNNAASLLAVGAESGLNSGANSGSPARSEGLYGAAALPGSSSMNDADDNAIKGVSRVNPTTETPTTPSFSGNTPTNSADENRTKRMDTTPRSATSGSSTSVGAEKSPSLSGVPSSSASLADALKSSDDFVDFYAMLAQPMDAPPIQLRSRINEVYAEAQANRDHRNPERRRQYALLLHWIPQARLVLLHEGKRSRYDEYAILAKSGAAPVNFRSALDEIIGESDLKLNEGESVLGMRTDGIAPPLPAAARLSPLPAAARLSPRLDAVRAAAGEGAVKASATAATLNDVVSNASAISSPSTASDFGAVASPISLSGAARTKAPVATVIPVLPPELLGETSTITANSAPSVSRVGATKTLKSSTRNTVVLNPELQRERASLFSSAIGAVTLLIVLILERALLSAVSPLLLCVAALAIGYMARKLALRQLSSGIRVER